MLVRCEEIYTTLAADFILLLLSLISEFDSTSGKLDIQINAITFPYDYKF